MVYAGLPAPGTGPAVTPQGRGEFWNGDGAGQSVSRRAAPLAGPILARSLSALPIGWRARLERSASCRSGGGEAGWRPRRLIQPQAWLVGRWDVHPRTRDWR